MNSENRNVETWLRSGAAYGRDIVESGWQGAVTGWRESEIAAVRSSLRWTLALVGASAGSLGGLLADRTKPARGAVWGALAGAAVGLGAALVWASRDRLEATTSAASRSVAMVRDAHWLERNPVAYG